MCDCWQTRWAHVTKAWHHCHLKLISSTRGIPATHITWFPEDISGHILREELSHTHMETWGQDSSISDMVHISSCRLPCSAHAVVSPSHAHSFPVARKTSGVGLVPPHQPIPHAGSFVLMEVLELQNPVGKWKKTKAREWGKRPLSIRTKILVVRYTINFVCKTVCTRVINLSEWCLLKQNSHSDVHLCFLWGCAA